MKQIIIGFLSGILFLSACGQSTPAPTIENSTLTRSPVPTGTATSVPSATPTETITPLPTISTFTATFDASTIATVTLAPKTECLNKAASEIAVSLVEEYKSRDDPQFIDLTNDGFVEIIIDGHREIQDGTGAILIFSCQEGSFNQIENYWADEYPSPSIKIIKDLNNNGVPEIVISKRECGGFGSCWLITIWEWDGEQFSNLESEHMNKDSSPWLDDVSFKDMDDNGTIEVIVHQGLPSHPDSLLHGPWRPYIATYSWNGREFALREIDMDEPFFRFEAVQDGDYASSMGNFEEAISLYQDVIFSDTLDWWSKERYLGQFQIDIFGNSPMPTLPAPDSTEYPRLAAYAYYRIMLIHLLQRHDSDADTVYNTLQRKFDNDSYGRAYVEMATAFWEAYLSTHKIYDGCAATIQYTVDHPEILIPLGSDYHGWQAKIYKPEDVCPFR